MIRLTFGELCLAIERLKAEGVSDDAIIISYPKDEGGDYVVVNEITAEYTDDGIPGWTVWMYGTYY